MAHPINEDPENSGWSIDGNNFAIRWFERKATPPLLDMINDECSDYGGSSDEDDDDDEIVHETGNALKNLKYLLPFKKNRISADKIT